VLTAKFVDAQPFYRQESQFNRLGLEIGRATMCNWSIKAATSCQPLLELLRRENRSGPLMNVDETTVQVLAEPGRAPTTKSYMWIFRGGDPSRPVLEFQYHQSRCADVAATYLRGYKGYVQTDGYVGYDFLDHSPHVVHVGCWAHVRRKFVEVIKAAGKIKSQNKTGLAEEAVTRISRIYAIERSMREDKLDAEKVYQERQEKVRPLLDDFYAWLKQKAPQTPPKSLLGKAISYALHQWKRLVRYLDDGRLRPDNNLAENAIRPFVVGRKNWLFSGNPEGAKASATLYSLIETAKANGLEPYWYLRYLFERLPFARTEKDYRALLPQYIDMPLVTTP
jgi:transposase